MAVITCPNCNSLLHKSDKMYQCASGHSFDISKDGYINLLLPNKKKKPIPGDNKAMINARETFLLKGHYDFLINSIDSVINNNKILDNSKTESTHLLDLGCGSGYYTRMLCKSRDVKKIGLDISKEAISKAAKKDKNSTYVVASSFDLPIQEETINVVLSVFSPLHLTEVIRVIKPGGFLLKIIPDRDHMKEVAAKVYDTIIPHHSTIESDLSSNGDFQIIDTLQISQVISLSDQELYNFISMTPYVYKFKPGQIEELKELSVTISFKIIVAKKEI